MHQNPHNNHQPVLLAETLTILSPKAGDRLLDVTAGYGGHAQAILKASGNYADSVLVDRDQFAISELKKLFSGSGISLLDLDFLSASRQLADSGKQFDLIIADLGVSSPHLNEASRGFSFNVAAPLDMRMDQRQQRSALDVVNNYQEQQLVEILVRYGEEPKAKRIARMIVEQRPLATTDELAAIALRAWPGRSRTHPATRLFQAIRIAVNDELSQLEQALPLWVDLLAPEGRLAVISFHSLEDRIVKQYFKEHAGNRFDAELRLLTKSPLTASPKEQAHNPRSRSAKLRGAAKTNIKRKGTANAN